MRSDQSTLTAPLVALILVGMALLSTAPRQMTIAFVLAALGVALVAGIYWRDKKSSWGIERQKLYDSIHSVPKSLLNPDAGAVLIGSDITLGTRVYLPERIRNRHVHIVGSTGSGKTESVVLNFLKQDTARGVGAVIVDAKGDASFVHLLRRLVPPDKLRIFDLGDEASSGYDPLQAGSAIESSQRLFASLKWSEEYYKGKALTALQQVFESHRARHDQNPSLSELGHYFSTALNWMSAIEAESLDKASAAKEFQELSGLRQQIQGLALGHLKSTLSPDRNHCINLGLEIESGNVVYFRLQSLMSPSLASGVGRLIINELNFIAGRSHRADGSAKPRFTPIYFDEFATFACEEFTDLISKSRSAGFALHFAHQSIGDLTNISPAFLNRITDNSATKIILRVNDPDSAEYFSRTFGTQLYNKATQRITNAKDLNKAEVLEEGSMREAHQFRAPPDKFKTLPTGMGCVLIAHGEENSKGEASNTFEIRFPRLTNGLD